MKDLFLFTFFSVLYLSLGLGLINEVPTMLLRFEYVSWPLLGKILLWVFSSLALARLTVVAFKPHIRNWGMPEHQIWSGVEEEAPQGVLDVIHPQKISIEQKSPKLKKKRKPK